MFIKLLKKMYLSDKTFMLETFRIILVDLLTILFLTTFFKYKHLDNEKHGYVVFSRK